MKDREKRLKLIASNIEEIDLSISDDKRDRFEAILYPALEEKDPGYELSIAEVVMMMSVMTAQHLYNSLESLHTT